MTWRRPSSSAYVAAGASDNYPYGGVKGSGLGREGVRYAMDELTEERVLVMRAG
jgi:acyl-CoA reductase-like NAD-dependent aldehyde dehydrogenase